MLAAIYARKSTDQTGVADDAKSVTRQIDHAKAYARGRGWAVLEDCVFVDDGISGAEFAARPGFVRLMTALKPRPAFQALVMSEESRLGRETIETSYALKQLIQAGVEVWFYMENRQRTLDSPTDKLLLSVAAYADELEREKARQRTYDAMRRKASAGQVTGGRVFGYTNVEIPGPDGQRSHVVRRVDEVEAATVRRAFELCANGFGVKRIAKTLNEEGAPSPRAQQGRPMSWAPSSVRSLIYRDLYRGRVVWNKTRKRNQWGQVRQRRRPADEWLTIEAPNLRIVSDELWNAAHARLDASRRTYLRGTAGHLWGRPPSGIDSKYLLTGLVRCGECGGGIWLRSRQHGKRRVHRYACSCHEGRGMCSNDLEALMEDADQAALELLADDALDPAVVEEVTRRAVAELLRSRPEAPSERERLTSELTQLDAESQRLTAAIAAGGNLAGLLEALRDRDQRRASLRARLDALEVSVRTVPLGVWAPPRPRR